MKKILILLSLLFIPIIIVNAEETVSYEVCKSGCEYNNLDDVYTAIYNLDKTKVYNMNITIKDDKEYVLSRSSLWNKYFQENTQIIKSTLLFKGTNGNPTITTDDEEVSVGVIDVDHMTFENLNFVDDKSVHFSAGIGHYNSDITIKNCNFITKDSSLNFGSVELDNVAINGQYFAIYSTTRNATIKNSQMKVTGGTGEHLGFRTDASIKTTIENSTIEATRFYPANSAGAIAINNSTITGPVNLYGNGDSITNSTINGAVSVSNNTILINNTTINSSGNYALGLMDKSCGKYSSSQNDIAQINGLTIKGNPKVGVKGFGTISNYMINVSNSDLSQTTCSMVLDIITIQACPVSSNLEKIYPTFLAQNYKNLNAYIKASKVNCAMVESHNTTMNAGNMYFDGTNTWTKQISRGTNKDSNNVVELNKGNIYIDFANKDILKLNVDLSKPIIDYFKDIIPEGKVLGEWRIEDPSILKVVDGKIVPLKVGVTRLVATIDNNNYVLEIEVTEDMLPKEEVNPKTGAFASYIIFVVLVMIAIIIINQKNKRLYKIK